MSFLIPDINTFFLLHTHFFSLLVYHVPILSCNPTVYTLCTVSTWGSVYIRQNDGRFCNQCPGNGCPLLLSSGKLSRFSLQFVLKTQDCYNLLQVFVVCTASIQFYRKDNIVIDVQIRHQIEILKNKSDLTPPENGQFIAVKPAQLLPVYHHTSPCGTVQTAQHVQKRTLTRTGPAYNGSETPLFYFHIDTIESFHQKRLFSIILREISCL